MDEPKISIVMPVYNVEKFLSGCLDSIIAQRFKDWECFCVDDGSPDGCPAILDEYAKKDSRIKAIHKENGGLSSARNAGLDAALKTMGGGGYIAFADSDDWAEERWLETLYGAAEKEDSDIVCCDFFMRYKNGFTEVRNNNPGGTGKEAVVRILQEKFHAGMWTKLIKKSLIEDNSIRFAEDVYFLEDMLFCVKAFYFAQKIAYAPVPLYNYYLGNMNSLTTKRTPQSFESHFKCVDEVILFLNQKSDCGYFRDGEDYLKAHALSDVAYCGGVLSKEQKKRYLRRYPEVKGKILKLKDWKFHLRLVTYLEVRGHFFLAAAIKAFYKIMRIARSAVTGKPANIG